MELVVFVLASAMVLAGAFGVVLMSNPVHAAMSLVLTLFGVAVHFVAMEAHFLAAVQVIVYAGAIVVLFLFVIMLLGVDRADDLQIEPFPIQRPLALVVGVGTIGLVAAAIVRAKDTVERESALECVGRLEHPAAGAQPVPGSRVRVRADVGVADRCSCRNRGDDPQAANPEPASPETASPDTASKVGDA